MLEENNINEEVTKIQLDKPTEEEIKETDPDGMCDHVDMMSEINELESENIDEDGESFDTTIDLSTIELDNDGVPVVTEEDLNSFQAFTNLSSSVMGMKGDIFAGHLNQIFLEIKENVNEYIQRQKIEPDSITEEERAQFDQNIQMLATIQKEGRNKEERIKLNKYYEAFDQAVIFDVFCTMLWRELIENKKEPFKFFDYKLSLLENLKSENYGTLLLKMIYQYINDLSKDSNIVSFLKLGSLDIYFNKYGSIYRRLFMYIGNVMKAKAALQCEKTINTLSSSIFDKVYDTIAISAVNNNDLQKIFIEKAFGDIATDEKAIDEKINTLGSQLESKNAYSELMSDATKDEMLNKMYKVTESIFNLMNKLSSDFDTKESFKNHLIKLLNEIEIEEKKILTKYNCKSFDDFAKQITDKIKEYDMPPMAENAQNDLIQNQNINEMSEEELEKIYSENLDAQSQIVRDKFTATHYPILEKMKVFRNLKIAISYYLSEPEDKTKAYNLIITLFTHYIQNLSLTTIFLANFHSLFDNKFINFAISNMEEPIETILNNKESLDFVKSRYGGNQLSIKNKEINIGRMLYDTAYHISMTEYSDTSDDYTDNIYKFYNTGDNVLKEFQIRPVVDMLKYNNLEALRYNTLDLNISIIQLVLDKFESIFDANSYIEVAPAPRKMKSNKRKRNHKVKK